MLQWSSKALPPHFPRSPPLSLRLVVATAAQLSAVVMAGPGAVWWEVTGLYLKIPFSSAAEPRQTAWYSSARRRRRRRRRGGGGGGGGIVGSDKWDQISVVGEKKEEKEWINKIMTNWKQHVWFGAPWCREPSGEMTARLNSSPSKHFCFPFLSCYSPLKPSLDSLNNLFCQLFSSIHFKQIKSIKFN